MIKKHLIPLAVIILLLIMAKVFTYTLPNEKNHLTNNTSSPENAVKEDSEKEASPFNIHQLTFADETLPLGDARVSGKMERTLAAFGYEQLQTYRLHRKAEEWFPIIEPILAAYGIPNDFKYMPLVESGLKAGVSPRGAAGYWQFMPATARMYGLKVNTRIDERNNLRKSTIAACRYLKELYGIFESWTLVAAAYNVGDVHLRRQINRQNQDNYFKMKLNRETGGYVYKLISVKEIVENPQRNGYREQKPLLAYRSTADTQVE